MPPDSFQGGAVVRKSLEARRSLKFQVIFGRIVVENEAPPHDTSAWVTREASWSKVTIS